MRRGFTLIELVIVVFMIGILVAMSTGVVYFLLWQYPESLGNIGYINKAYNDVANDLMLVQYSDKIVQDENGIKLYYWDSQDQRFYTKYLSNNKSINYLVDTQTRSVTIMIDNSIYNAHALHEPVPFPKSIVTTPTITTVTLLYPAILEDTQLTPTGTIQCTNSFQLEDRIACTVFTIPTASTATFTYTINSIRDVNLKPYTYELQTTQMLDIPIPSLPTFLKENPL